MMQKMEDIMSKLVVHSQEARAAREEEQGRSRGGVPERGSGGNSQNWHIDKAFKPWTKMNLEMTVQELQIWERTWEQYFNVSMLNQTPSNI